MHMNVPLNHKTTIHPNTVGVVVVLKALGLQGKGVPGSSLGIVAIYEFRDWVSREYKF